MVSQSSSWEDSLVDPWEGGSEYSGSIDGSPRLLDTGHPACQSDLRFTRHKATWINPQCMEQQLQDLPVQIPTVGNSGSYFVRDGASPLGPSPLSLEYSVVETVLSKDTVGSVGSSGEKSSSFSFTSTQEQTVLPGSSPWMSLFARSKILTASPRSEADSACFTPSHLPVSTGEGAVQFSGRSISLNSFSQETFVFPVDIEKENAHFYASDMIISVMENMKCDILSQQHMESWSTGEANGSLWKNQADSKMTFYNIKQESGSSTSSDSGYELGEFSNTTETCRCTCSSSKSIIYEPNFNSAELIAKELYKVFQKCWMLSQVNYQLAGSLNASGSIVVSEERVQKDFESSVDKVEEIEFKPKIRGMEDWAPPRFQVIFNVHPPLKRDLVVAAQNFFCAGCGTPIEPNMEMCACTIDKIMDPSLMELAYRKEQCFSIHLIQCSWQLYRTVTTTDKFVKRLRYCEYLGKYFCDCCHSYAESCLPARILTMWDFRKYHVSNFSKWLLNSLWHQPIFNLLNTSHSLYAKAKELDKVREIQEQLFHIKKLLKTCRFAESALKEFEQVPRHLTDELHLFSLEDMIRVKKGMLVPLLKDVLKATLAHVACCELCQGKGFICEFCRSTVVIFPFQTTTCRRCSACRACFHKQCFRASECPRCARITARRRLLESLPSAAT